MDEMMIIQKSKAGNRWREKLLKIGEKNSSEEVSSPSFTEKVANFFTTVVEFAYKRVKGFFVSIYQNFESIIVLTLSAIGLTALLSELPFIWTLPMWIEATMVIPVCAVIIITVLMKIGEWRAARRVKRNMSAMSEKLIAEMMSSFAGV